MAVFGVELEGVKLSKQFQNSLANYLATRLTESGKYQVIPRDQLKKRLLGQKKKSFKECYDQSCQIEIGKELAAEKTLSARIAKLGKRCTVSLTLYDLKKSTTEAAASQHGKCGEDNVIDSIDKALNKLFGVAMSPVVSKTPASKSGPAGIEWVHSSPAGIDFTKSEVTVAQYRACVKAGKCSEPKTKSDDKYCNWGNTDRDQHPINCVDWNQATAFCEWAGGRLPTEQEWEAEASNKGSRKYPWGEEEVNCDRAAWDQGGHGCGRDSTWPVCAKEGGNSASGLCDMSGNVWEWVSSWEDNTQKAHVLRGGSWWNNGKVAFRASYRAAGNPSSWTVLIGLRCVRASP
ncbi:MAG: SUMF1/EgtB/PvdO family nonheme iron enzyme [Deltaproteobacteria bacterium]|nr:SUMF1/EgtB/PvdO family nonheme iron enzyme [Deltaproteobacteria bacterium]